jgi:hypothetical protein
MRLRAVSLLATASLFSLVQGTAHAAEAAAPAPDASAGVDTAQSDIVVTAQKREQKLKDVPLTVSVVTQDKLSQLGVSELGEMAAYVPGLQIQKQSANNPGFVIAASRPTAARLRPARACRSITTAWTSAARAAPGKTCSTWSAWKWSRGRRPRCLARPPKSVRSR